MTEERYVRVSGYVCAPATPSFFDAAGVVDEARLRALSHARSDETCLGWFVARRATPLAPSLAPMNTPLGSTGSRSGKGRVS